MAYLELKNVSFQYPNGYTAVENVSMESSDKMVQERHQL